MEIPTYIVFGATGGIGSELARVLASEDFRVVLVGRNAAKLAELSDELHSATFDIEFEPENLIEDNSYSLERTAGFFLPKQIRGGRL